MAEERSAGAPLEDFGQRRASVREGLAGLGQAARELEMPREAESLAELGRRVEEDLLKLIVIGEFNRGKSSFINALLGRRVLPTAVRPTTATLNVIRWGETPRARATFVDGTSEGVDLGRLEEYVTVKGEQVPRVKLVEIFYPTPFCQRGVQIVDTPGVNDLDRQREEITYGFIPGSDAAILVLDSEAAVSRSEKTFLDEKILRNDIRKIFLVLNKADELNPAELDEVLTYARDKLKDLVPGGRLWPVSAKEALKAKEAGDAAALERSGLPAFERALGEFLVKDRGAVALQVPVARGVRLGRRLATAAALRREGLHMARAELAAKSARLEPLLVQHDTTRAALEARLKKAAEELARTFEGRAREGLLGIRKELEGTVDEGSIEPQFIQELLPDLLRRKVSTLLEEHQKTIAERLAELERRAAKDVAVVLQDLDAVVWQEFSFTREKGMLEDVRLARSQGTKETVFDVAPIVAGSLVGFVGFSLLGLLGLVPAYFGAKYVREFFQERRQSSLKGDLKQMLAKLLQQVEDQVVADTKTRIEQITGDIRTQLGRQLEESAGSVRQTLERMRADEAAGAGEASVQESRLLALEERVQAEVLRLLAQEAGPGS